MRYLHDIWFNAVNNDNPYLIHHYHEWYKDDEVRLMDQTVVLKVNENLQNYLEFGLRKIPKDMLNVVLNKSYERTNNKRLQIKYGFIVSDGNRVMMIIADKDGRVENKSRLIPRQHLLVLELLSDDDIDYILESKVNVSKFPIFVGKTRNEKNQQILAANFINKLVPNNLGLLKYIISEYDLNLYKKLTGSFDEIKQWFLDIIRNSDVRKLIELNRVLDKLKIIN